MAAAERVIFTDQFRRANPALASMVSYMTIATPTNDGGYDYDFISKPPDRLTCNICQLTSRDPYLSVCCGHVFCKSCLDNIKKACATSNACPVCRDEEFVTFPNKQLDREIKSLLVYCTNEDEGCEWQGEMNNINKHLSGDCQFEEVTCFNDCGKMMQRQYLTGHVETECPRRKINCQYCHDTGEHQFIEGQHKEECPELPIPCPNNCEVASVPREDMEAHRKDCPLEMIQCEYHNVGCEVRLVRKDQEEHENEKVKEHLMMTKYKLSKLDDVQQELADTKASLDAALKQITNLTALVNVQMSPNVSRDNIRSIYLDTMATIFGSQAYPITIKMSNYNVNKKEGMQWYSEPFYSHNMGYKMCMKIYGSGYDEGKNTHLSVFLFLMKGPHDDELTWPLRGKFHIKLLNQISDREHHPWTLDYDDEDDEEEAIHRVTEGDMAVAGLGTSQFISNKMLYKATQTRQYLKNDCLFFQITKL